MQKKYRACDGKTVLIVDDDEICRCVTGEILNNLGLHVHLAPDAEHAVTLAKHHAYDLVLLDMRMPDMTGEQLAEEILEFDNVMKDAVFLLTGEEDIAEVKTTAQGLKLGVLRKPLDGVWVESYFSRQATTENEKNCAGPQIEGFDTCRAIKNFMGYESAFFNILREFPDYGAKFIAEYSAHLRTKNFKECQRLAHSIKGSSLMIGAGEINKLAKELESTCFSSTDMRQIEASFRKIEEKILQASESVKKHFQQHHDQ